MSASGPSNDDDSGGLITDINVTPMVDVMLVLLVIFMVTASLITSPSLKVELPKGSAKASETREQERDIAVVVTRTGELRYQDKPVAAEALVATLSRERKARPTARLVIIADQKSYHGQVVRVMDIAKSLGFQRIGVAIDPRR